MGLFVVLEGADFVGTTTHSRLLVQNLTRLGYDAVLTSEPWGDYGRIARATNECNNDNEERDPFMTQMLFCLDRAEHQTELRKHLGLGLLNDNTNPCRIVVCDRYTLSTMVYGRAMDLATDQLDALEATNKTFISPDITFVLNAPLQILLERKKTRTHTDSFETEAILQRVAEGYASFSYRDGIIPASTTRSIEATSKFILESVLNHISLV